MEARTETPKIVSSVSSFQSWYVLSLLALAYGIGELSHFLVGATSRSMAQELHYGLQSCLQNNDIQLPTETNITCSDLDEVTRCNDSFWGNSNTSYCQWDYNGLGLEYQILAGPSFILALTIGGLILGALADRFNRIMILAASVVLFSCCTLLMGMANAVWQLIVLRMGLAFGEAACQPISASLVSSLFRESLHGVALAIVNWGIYLGYGLSYIMGNYVPAWNILDQGWRWAYYLSSFPGFFVAVLLFFTASDPRTSLSTNPVANDVQISLTTKDDQTEESNSKETLQLTEEKHVSAACSPIRHFFQPSILLLCVAACIRHTAGFSWAYNSQLYYNTYYPGVDVGLWLFFASLVGGSAGLLAGGAVSDKIVKKIGLKARALVLGTSQLLATPCAAGVLLLPPPYSFISLIVAYIFAEMWFGALFAILVELFPSSDTSLNIAVFLFVMNNVGGNVPVAIDPLSRLMGYRNSLLLFYPGFLLLSAVLFGSSALLVRKT